MISRFGAATEMVAKNDNMAPGDVCACGRKNPTPAERNGERHTGAQRRARPGQSDRKRFLTSFHPHRAHDANVMALLPTLPVAGCGVVRREILTCMT